MQLFDQKFADQFEFDTLDPTKLIPEEVLPPVPVGHLVLDRMPDNFFAETEQVAFMTQRTAQRRLFQRSFAAGEEFLLFGDQLKRLGSPNFTHLPINAPNARSTISSRTAIWRCAIRSGAPIISRTRSARGPESRPSVVLRPLPLLKTDPSSASAARVLPPIIARQDSSTSVRREQHHIAAALTFELSKVKTTEIRERVVSHSLNVDNDLAKSVSGSLGLASVPKPAAAAVATRENLEPSPALSIVHRGPESFEGRKLGILVTDGTNAPILSALKKALTKEGATLEIIAPKVGGVKVSDGSLIPANQMIDGGPSVLYDAVALLPADDAIDNLVQESTARDFVADAFAHCKFIGYTKSVGPLFEKAGIAESLDEGCIALSRQKTSPNSSAK